MTTKKTLFPKYTEKPMSIKVVLALSNRLFSDGIKRLLENERDITVAGVLKSGAKYTVKELEGLSPNIILTDIMTLYNYLPIFEQGPKDIHIVLLDTNSGRETIVATILKKRLNGVLLSDTSPELLKKCIRSVAKGEVWLDKHTFKNILYGINALEAEKTESLSAREEEIVALTGIGLRNKEIAHRLHISEPTVKTHLTRIFKKLNLKARAELISYAIKNHEIGGLIQQTKQAES